MCQECGEKKVETKVCKICGEEKPINEFQGRDKGYHRTSCKVCEYIKKHNIIADNQWALEEYKIIIDCLLNKKINYLNEILLQLNHKTMEDLLLVLDTKITISNVPLLIKQKCLFCENDLVMKPYEYINKSKKFCSQQCNINYNMQNGTWGNKPKNAMQWFNTKEEFIKNYRILGLNETARLYNKDQKTIGYWASKYGLNRESVVDNLTEEEIIIIYTYVLDGRLKSGFPNGFAKIKKYVNFVIRYLFNNILIWNRDDVCKNFTVEVFKNYKLDSIINKNIGFYKNIESAFPEYNIKVWEYQRKNLSSSFWKNSNIKDAFTWLKNKLYVEMNVKSVEDLKKYNLKELLHNYGLHGLCISKYNYDVEKMFSDIYGEDVKESDIIVYHHCTKCNQNKPYTKEFFPYGKIYSLFRLDTMCKECVEDRQRRKSYLRKGIIYNNTEQDIEPVQWYNYLMQNKITKMPRFCYEKESMVKIIRYLLLDKLKINNKHDMCFLPIFQTLSKYKIGALGIFQNKIELLQLCFPEYNFIEEDLDIYNDNNVNNIINNWRKERNISVEFILSNRGLENKYNHDMRKMVQSKKKNGMQQIDMFLWYFHYNDILHSKTGNKINILDFENQKRGFWNIKENRIKAVKYYCEEKCMENILDNIRNFNDLKQWIYKYFKPEDLKKNLYYFNSKTKIKWYDLLIESYPIIKENKLFFEWEWFKNDNIGKNYLINVLKEFIFYRADDIFKNLKEDIPKYFNLSYMRLLSPKLSSYVSEKKIFESFYEWACLSFPEFKNDWNGELFGLCIAYDGTILDSKQEMMIYEYIKKDLSLEYIKHIGSRRTGKYVFRLDDSYEYNKFCPDFVIEYININGKKHKLLKPILFEYYGLYQINNDFPMVKNYVEKTKIKNLFYKSKEDIYFIDLYPEDLRNNFEGLVKKLSSFFMSNFNIDIHNINNIMEYINLEEAV
jgi:transposase-like protein